MNTVINSKMDACAAYDTIFLSLQLLEIVIYRNMKNVTCEFSLEHEQYSSTLAFTRQEGRRGVSSGGLLSRVGRAESLRARKQRRNVSSTYSRWLGPSYVIHKAGHEFAI